MIKIVNKFNIWGVFTFLFSLILYGFTIRPSIDFIDSGELAQACFKMSIPHPTGYPIYVLIGRCWILILNILKIKPVIAMNLLSLLTTSISLVFLYKTLRLTGLKNYLSSILSILFGMVYYIWDNATTTEVYSISLLFSTILIYLALKIKFECENISDKYFTLLIYFTGLSLTHHLSVILIIPSILIIIGFKNLKQLIKDNLIKIIFFFLFGLLPYLYLIIRSKNEPFLNWSNPSQINGLIAHITGWQYRVWMFPEGISGIFKQLNKILPEFLKNISVGLSLLFITGIYYGFKKYKSITIAFILIILLTLIYSSGYTIPDLEGYLALTSSGVILISGTGIKFFYERSKKFFIIIGILLLASLIQLLIKIPSMNHKDDYLIEDISRTIINKLP